MGAMERNTVGLKKDAGYTNEMQTNIVATKRPGTSSVHDRSELAGSSGIDKALLCGQLQPVAQVYL